MGPNNNRDIIIKIWRTGGTRRDRLLLTYWVIMVRIMSSDGRETSLLGHLRNPGTETFHRQQAVPVEQRQEPTIWDGWQEIALFSDTGVI